MRVQFTVLSNNFVYLSFFFRKKKNRNDTKKKKSTKVIFFQTLYFKISTNPNLNLLVKNE